MATPPRGAASDGSALLGGAATASGLPGFAAKFPKTWGEPDGAAAASAAPTARTDGSGSALDETSAQLGPFGYGVGATVQILFENDKWCSARRTAARTRTHAHAHTHAHTHTHAHAHAHADV